MARAAKAFSAISMGAAFVLTTGEAGAQSARASAENGFSPINGTAIGFNDDGDLRVLLASGEETIIPRGEYGLVGDQIMVSDMIQGVEVAQNGYIPPTSGGAPVYGNPGPFGLGYATWLVPLGLVAAGVIAYILITRSNNDAPSLGAESYSDTIAEGAATTTVLFSASATDAEGDAITFSLSGADAASFDIDPASGDVTWAAVPDFEPAADANGDNVYSFNVVATDEHGKASAVTAEVTLTDTNTNEASGGYTGDNTDEDIEMTTAVTGTVDMSGGDDDLLVTEGMSGTGSIDAGTGADVVTLVNTAMAAGNSIDMGTGNDVLIINAALAAAPTIDLGSGADILDINVIQTAVLAITGFAAGDVLDLTGIAGISTFNATEGVTLTDNGVVYAEAGGNVTLSIDNTGDGVSDMSLTLVGITALTADNVLV
ncbi:MAG: hypothetical protein ACPG42_08970 [Alphaproteobacteria bacterium]